MVHRVGRADLIDSPLDSIGDHPAINFINTLRMVEGELTDTWQRDRDVAAWMVREGLRESFPSTVWGEGVLLRKARLLRQVAKEAIEARKAKKPVPLEVLQGYLNHAVSHCVLKSRSKTNLHLERQYRDKTVEEYLAPLAETVAELLSNGDFDLIRHCEGEHCVLWFYDRTKAHRRRWCSPQVCGNRAKVAAFRARGIRRSAS